MINTLAPSFASVPRNRHQTWVLANNLFQILPRANPVTSNTADQQFMAVRASIAHELNLLGNTRCAICGGFGHSHKICPTNRRLKHFSKAGIAQSILKRVKDQTKQSQSRINNGQDAPWSLLPAAIGFKRPRNMAGSLNAELGLFDNTAVRRARRNSLT